MITRVAFAGSVALTKGSSPVGQKNLFDERRKVLEVSGLCLPVAKGLGRVTLFQVQVATCSESGSLPMAGFQLRLGVNRADSVSDVMIIKFWRRCSWLRPALISSPVTRMYIPSCLFQMIYNDVRPFDFVCGIFYKSRFEGRCVRRGATTLPQFILGSLISQRRSHTTYLQSWYECTNRGLYLLLLLSLLLDKIDGPGPLPNLYYGKSTMG